MHTSPAITDIVSGSPKTIMPVRDAATGSTLARMDALPLSVCDRPFVQRINGRTVETIISPAISRKDEELAMIEKVSAGETTKKDAAAAHIKV